MPFDLEPSRSTGSGPGVDDVDGGGEQHAVAFQAGGMAGGDAEMGFTGTDAAEENNIGLIVDELETKKILDL
ncbi:MAG: hypothetical protein L0Y58_04745 [Verrucomicrobia subdivision 3 bacterium]|nr:hypothetical protein [Limisphaerales bacterium]